MSSCDEFISSNSHLKAETAVVSLAKSHSKSNCSLLAVTTLLLCPLFPFPLRTPHHHRIRVILFLPHALNRRTRAYTPIILDARPPTENFTQPTQPVVTPAPRLAPAQTEQTATRAIALHVTAARGLEKRERA